MYPNIPWETRAKTANESWGKLENETFPDHFITPEIVLAIIMFTFSHAFFTFGDKTFRQFEGTAMGSRLGVGVANSFMSLFLATFFASHLHYKPFFPYLTRFLDDIFGFCLGTESDFHQFVPVLNTWSTSEGWNIQLSVTKFGTPTPSLDLEVYWGNQWHTTLFY